MQANIFQSHEEEISNGIFSVIKRNFFSIPVSIRIISFSLFIFLLGWGLGADAFFSLYIQHIVDNIFLISVIGAIMPLSKIIFSLPIGELDNHTNLKSVIFLGKIFYVVCGILFFLAGIFHCPWLLVVAVIINGFASAALFTSYESYIRIANHKQESGSVRGLYFSSANAAYVIGALIGAVLIFRIPLEYVFLFIALFSLISLFTDKKIPLLNKSKVKLLFSKESFLHQFMREVFSFTPIKKVVRALPGYGKQLMYALSFEVLFNIMNYIGFIFIPLVAATHHFSLSQIALLFALMRLPYLSNFFTVDWVRHYDKKSFIIGVLLFLAFLYGSLAFTVNFGGIILISLGIALGLAMIRPVISDLVSEQTQPHTAGTITGVQQCVAMIGNSIGILGFGAFSYFFGMSLTFLLVGLGLFVLASWGIAKKRHLL